MMNLVTKADLEKFVTKQDLEHFKADLIERFATKEDLHRELHAQTWRFISALVGAMAVMTAVFGVIVKGLP